MDEPTGTIIGEARVAQNATSVADSARSSLKGRVAQIATTVADSGIVATGNDALGTIDEPTGTMVGESPSKHITP